jgi:hypothetical protein
MHSDSSFTTEYRLGSHRNDGITELLIQVPRYQVQYYNITYYSTRYLVQIQIATIRMQLAVRKSNNVGIKHLIDRTQKVRRKHDETVWHQRNISFGTNGYKYIYIYNNPPFVPSIIAQHKIDRHTHFLLCKDNKPQ